MPFPGGIGDKAGDGAIGEGDFQLSQQLQRTFTIARSSLPAQASRPPHAPQFSSQDIHPRFEELLHIIHLVLHSFGEIGPPGCQQIISHPGSVDVKEITSQTGHKKTGFGDLLVSEGELLPHAGRPCRGIPAAGNPGSLPIP